MKQTSFQEIVKLIKDKWSCVDYCRTVLGLPINRSGDRCFSPLHPGRANREDAFLVHDEYWIDWEEGGKGGDVIELCALTRHNGDRAAAFKELGAEFFSGYDAQSWQAYSESLTKTIERWHHILTHYPVIRDINGNNINLIDYLHSRRISDATIAALKLGYCSDSQSAMCGRLIIPYFQNGEPVYYAGRDMSGKWKTDKTCGKYKKKFTGASIYSRNVPWGLDSLAPFNDNHTVNTSRGIIDKNKYLIIGEGMFDIISFWQERWHVLSSIGGYFSKKIMPMIADIAHKFDKVFVCFDSDAPGQAFQLAMSKFLFTNRIPFVCGHLPAMFNGQAIKDVSDFYAAGGNLAEIVACAVPGIVELGRSFPEGSEQAFKSFMTQSGRFADKPDLALLAKSASTPDLTKLSSLDEPTKDAIIKSAGHLDADFVKACIDDARKAPSEITIVDDILSKHNVLYMVKDGFYEYNHGVWASLPDQAVEYYAREALGDFATFGRMRSACKHLASVRWNTDEFNSQAVINFPNGILDLDTLELVPHSPSFMSTIQLPYCYDPSATCPLWEKFIHDITQNDNLLAVALGELTGYILFPDCSLETGFFLMGEGANGKSVFINTLRHVFGTMNCSSVEPSRFADPFEPMALRHSIVNFATETRLDIHSNEAAIKKIISGENIRAAHKGIDAVDFRSRAKFVCACNSFINSKDITYGFMRRFMFIPFERTFVAGEADTQLTGKLIQEAPGIFNWALQYYKRLCQNRKFTSFPQHERELATYMTLANPLAGFIDMKLMNIHDSSWTTTDLYITVYKTWCAEVGCQPVNLFNFTKQLKTLMKQKRPEVKFARAPGGSATKIIFPADNAAKSDEDSEWENI